MNVDAFVLSLIAIADLTFLISLRRKRHQTLQAERVRLSLEAVVRREAAHASHAQLDGALLDQ